MLIPGRPGCWGELNKKLHLDSFVFSSLLFLHWKKLILFTLLPFVALRLGQFLFPRFTLLRLGRKQSALFCLGLSILMKVSCSQNSSLTSPFIISFSCGLTLVLVCKSWDQWMWYVWRTFCVFFSLNTSHNQ